MGQREMIFTIGAIILFSINTLTINRLGLVQSTATTNQQVEFYAVNLAQRFIEEAKTRAFDENVINATPVALPDGFTDPPLGPGGGESYPNFDDVDDFNGLNLAVPTRMDSMTVTVTVDYVSEANLDSVVTNKTFFKRMRVQVRSPYLNRPMQASYVFAFQRNW